MSDIILKATNISKQYRLGLVGTGTLSNDLNRWWYKVRGKEDPFFVKEYSNDLPFYEVRHLIRPGITGWAQVNARYGSSEQDTLEKLQYDLFYMKRRSLALDINILIKTLSTVIFYRGQ